MHFWRHIGRLIRQNRLIPATCIREDVASEQPGPEKKPFPREVLEDFSTKIGGGGDRSTFGMAFPTPKKEDSRIPTPMFQVRKC